MNDLAHVGTFFLIFAAALGIYGMRLAQTGDKKLLPYRTLHSIRGPEDVKRVGRIVTIVGLAIGIVALVIRIAAQ